MSKREKQLIKTHFNKNIGFGKHKNLAIKLLKNIVQILDEYHIDYFLISGTLLGHIRHNDFIPWDDDIDLIVDGSFLDKQSEIKQKYKNLKIVAMPSCKWMIKACYKKGPKIHTFDKYKWTWPFIDLFIFGYDEDRTYIQFFEKKWPADKFFPPKKESFLDMVVSIPQDPHYFLEKNYGPNYMTVYKSSTWCHKYERRRVHYVQIDAKTYKRTNYVQIDAKTYKRINK